MYKKLLERILARLNDKYVVDHEVMEEDDTKQLLEDIKSLKKLIEDFSETELIGCYCPSQDKTFVQRCEYFHGELLSETCVGWYHGEPDEVSNKEYANDNLTATYVW